MKVHLPKFEDYQDLSGTDGFVFTFGTERGVQHMSYPEYLADTQLREWVNDKQRYRLTLGRTVFSYSYPYLKSHGDTLDMVRVLAKQKEKNPLRFFAPSTREMLDFLNDYENNLCILYEANRLGKTQTMLIKKLINNIPCDPSWEIFTRHGVKYREFRGPTQVGLGTYDLGFHRDTTLPMLLAWVPNEELGVYSKDYKGKGAKQVNLNNIPKLPLECGTIFNFASMSQGQSPFEGNVKHDWGWDEQGNEAAFDGADERTRTVEGRHDFGLTPHKIEGRPDTGAGSWIHKIVDGEITKGKRIGVYHSDSDIFCIPDWIYPETEKVAAFYKHVVEPIKLNDSKKKREGDSRFFGKFHESSGLVIDEWDSEKHVIEPFDIPSHWTRFRGVDHGSQHPAACLWAAISPGGDLFIYRDYLRTGRVVTQIAKDIIELSGNKRRKIGSYRNPKSDLVYDKYEEVQNSEAFQWTVFDARAFSQTQDGIKLSQLYGFAGLKMKQGSGKDSDAYVPILKEWFYVDPSKKHFVTGEDGAPRVYVFATCTDFIRTIRRWVWEERKTRGINRLAKESPTKKDDDLCDCMKLIIQAQPRFCGNPRMSDAGMYDEDGEERRIITNKPINGLTGY